MDVLRGVGGGELAGEVGEVGEGQLARVGALADAEEDDVGVDEVVDREEGGRGFDGGLGFGGAGEFAEDLAELLLDFVEGGGVGLCFVVDGGAKHEAVQPRYLCCANHFDLWVFLYACYSRNRQKREKEGEEGIDAAIAEQ